MLDIWSGRTLRINMLTRKLGGTALADARRISGVIPGKARQLAFAK